MSAAATFDIASPVPGESIRIPADISEDLPYFTLDQADELRRYYDENGYVVIRGLVPPELCDNARSRFEQEVKPYGGFIYRQASANPERHVMTGHGYMLNSILNVQSIDARRFPAFRRSGVDVFTQPATQQAAATLLGEPGKLVQSMYFEGNPATWPHQDTYYLDAEEIGRMSAAWFAMEDIAPGAGRFFVYPKSHLIDLKKNGGDFDIAFNHDRYKHLVIDIIKAYRLPCHAPALRKGDALFWAAKTIHGSLQTSQPQFSRSSFTAHFIPESSRFLQHQSRVRGLNLSRINGLSVHSPKSLDRPLNRVIFWVETTFPTAFQTAKKVALKLLSLRNKD